MRNFTKKGFLMGTALMAASFMYGQKPQAEIIKLVCEDGARLQKVSDNGQWAVGSYINDAGQGINAHLWDLRGNEIKDTPLSEGDEICSAHDVSDDGTIVVGSFADMPAYYKNGEWIELPVPEDLLTAPLTGEVRSVSADGKTMVGLVWGKAQTTACACIWKEGELELPTLPEKDITGDKARMNTFDDVSGDGSLILGFLNYNILPGRTQILYRNNQAKIYAEDQMVVEDEFGKLYCFVDESCISPNGKYIGGIFHYVIPTGEWNPEEYDTSYIYDVENDKFINLEGASTEIGIFGMDNQGVAYAASPINYPIRSAKIYLNEEYKDFSELLNDYFDLDFSETGFAQTGSIIASADGKVIGGMATMAGNNYIVKLPCNLADYEEYTASISSKAFVKSQVSAEGYVLNITGEVKNLAITDLSGKTVKNIQNPSNTVNVSELAAGIYVTTLTTPEGNQYVSKVCIK